MRILIILILFGIGYFAFLRESKPVERKAISTYYTPKNIIPICYGWQDTIPAGMIDTTQYKYDEPQKACILLTFNGFLSKQTYYMTNNFLPSLILDSVRTEIQKGLARYYDKWDVVITQDDSLFYTFPVNHRIRVLLTRSYAKVFVYGEYYALRAVSKYNTLYLRDTTPCVLSLPTLDSTAEYLSTVAAHETGHAFGLAHQSLIYYGKIVEDYNPGNNDSIPIMGGDGHQKRYWTIGINDFGQEQDDTAVLSRTIKRIK